MKFTILGSNGFIGSNLIKYLNNKNIECYSIDIRKQNFSGKSLGHVIYAIGLTSDFRKRRFDTVQSHVCSLIDFLKSAKFESFLYISSTRIYKHSNSTNEESPLVLNPTQPSDLYDISKVMGESVCLTLNKPHTRIARISNVVGNNLSSDDFLPSIIKDAVKKKKIILNTSLESEKDYITINDVVKILTEIAIHGKHKIYNIASGQNIKSKEIINKIKIITKCHVEEIPGAENYSFPRISIQRIKNEFGFNPLSIFDKIEELILSYKS